MVEEFSHDRDDDLLGWFSVGDEPVSEGLEWWVEDSRVHCREEESAPQRSGADLRDWCSGASRGSADKVPWSDSRPGSQLSSIAKEFDLRQFGEEDLTSDFSEGGNTHEKIEFGLEPFVGEDEFLDPRSDVSEFLFLGFDAAPK